MMDMLLLGPSSDSYVAIIFVITCEFFEARNGCAKKSSMLMQKDILIHEKVFLNRAFWVQFNFLLYSLSYTMTTINVIIITVTTTKIIIMPKLYLVVGAANSCRHIPLLLS